MMRMTGDTSALVGGPINRYGGKGRTARHLTPYFAPATIYAEPCFGAGSVFFSLPEDTYKRVAVNDSSASLVTFFRVLRDRPDELIQRCELTPYARDEFITALTHSDDPLEEARRVWVRHRQGTAGAAETAGDWGRNPGSENIGGWNPRKTETKLAALGSYAARLRTVAIDNVDCVEFIDKWGMPSTFVYVDPPYVGTDDYDDTVDHPSLAAACRRAVERGALVAVSGYPSPLYDELFSGWRTVSVDVPLYGARDTQGQRRVEMMWMSYPRSMSFIGIEEARQALAPRTLFDIGAPTAARKR